MWTKLLASNVLAGAVVMVNQTISMWPVSALLDDVIHKQADIIIGFYWLNSSIKESGNFPLLMYSRTIEFSY